MIIFTLYPHALTLSYKRSITANYMVLNNTLTPLCLVLYKLNIKLTHYQVTILLF